MTGPDLVFDDDVRVTHLTPTGPVDPGYEASGSPTMTPSAEAAADGGYAILDSWRLKPLGLAAGYTIHLVNDHAQYDQMLAPASAAAIQLTAATGIPFTIGETVSEHSGREVADHRITISLTSGWQCGDGGCADFKSMDRGGSYMELVGAAVWVNPSIASFPGPLLYVILHELGHAAGLDHYDSDFEGQYQVVRTFVAPYTMHHSYQTGDQNGLARTAANGVSNGYLIPRACLIRIIDVRITDQFCSDIRWLVESGIGRGYTDGSFRPTSMLTRQVAAAFLYALAGEPPVSGNAPNFPDVPVGHQFRDAIRWMAAEGITSGYPDGTFRPAATLTRQTMAAFLHNYAGSPAVPGDALDFPDVPVGHQFRDAIGWMAAEGITSGYPDGTFRPTATLTRQTMAAFLHDYET